MGKSIPADFIPNYKDECQCCGQLPTINIKEKKSGKLIETQMCGVCTFGEAQCADPANW